MYRQILSPVTIQNPAADSHRKISISPQKKIPTTSDAENVTVVGTRYDPMIPRGTAAPRIN
jgi:hypothetical protein